MDAKVCSRRGGIWNQKEKICKYKFQNYGQISKQFSANLKRYESEEDKIQDKLKRLKRKQERLSQDYPSWTDDMIGPVADAMVKKLPDRTYDILGPFGLTAETSIHFYKKGATEKNRFEGDNCISITFRPGELRDGELELVDHTKQTGRYPIGSIGEMNRMNYPAVSIPKNADAKWLIEYMKKQTKEGK